jgi:hypothetical protein
MGDFTCKYRNSGVGGNDPQECAWPQCGCDPHANKVLEHIDECGFVIVDQRLLKGTLARAATVLSNMAAENDRPWWNFWTPRWPISHEPLRGDARNVLPLIAELLAQAE